jgi:hypothetical protein
MKTKKNHLILSIFLLLLLVNLGNLSALDWDNVKRYDENTKTATVVNSLGLGRDIAELQLLTPLNNKVGLGYQRVAEIKINNYDSYENALKQLDFYNIKSGMKKFERNFDYKYKSTETYEVQVIDKECEEVLKNGSCSPTYKTETREREVWKEIGKDLPKGEVTIGIYTNVQKGDHVEWIPTWFGVKIDEWAIWTADLNTDLTYYWNMSSGAEAISGVNNLVANEGSAVYSTSGALLNGAGVFSHGNNQRDASGEDSVIDFVEDEVTLNVWINASSFANYRFFLRTGGEHGSGDGWYMDFRGGNSWHYCYLTNEECGSIPISGLNEWHMLTTKKNSTAVGFFLDGTEVHSAPLAPSYGLTPENLLLGTDHAGAYDYLGMMDELAFWNRSLTDDEITQLYNSGDGLTYTTVFVPVVTIVFPEDSESYDTDTLNLNYTVTGDYLDRCWYSKNSGVTNSSTVSAGTNWTGLSADEGSNTWTVYCNNTDRVASDSVTFTTDTLSPEINIIYPNGTVDYHASGTNITLNWSITEENLDSCWYEYDGTNYSIAESLCTENNSTSFNVTDSSKRTVKFYANDTAGNVGEATTGWEYTIWENSRTYNPTSTITTNEQFKLNITSDGTQTPIVYLNYNGTNHLTSLTEGEYVVTIPMIFAGVNPFYWNITYGSANFVTTSNTQTVSGLTDMQIVSGSCPTGLTKVLNFTFYDETNLTQLTNMEIKYNFQYGISNSTGAVTFGNLNATEFSVCLNTTTATEYSIGYGEIDYTKDNYVSRRYYIFEGTKVSNVTTHTSLYSLLSSESTSFLAEVRTPTLTPYVGKYTALLRWYPNLDEYVVVEMGKTDDKGQTVKRVKIEDVDYRIGVYDTNGTLIYLANPTRMVCLTSPCSYTLTIREDSTYLWNEIENIQAEITYNSTSGIVTLVYNDPSQNTELMELKVYRVGGHGSDDLICSSNGTSFTGILTCNISAYDGKFKAVALRSASPTYPVTSLTIDTLTTVFSGTFGLFIQFIIAVVVAFSGIISPVVGIVLGVLSLVIGTFFLGTTTLAVFIGICLMGGMVIYFIKRSS